ncbi:hypothetical protein MSAN_02093700 [Mycena sanguinolenta]|uniref:Uncharacterized protein n=1 Tax=Mycena sanguinolenta TaxID=230812 RepID=A0A8H6XID8_9AGAR|nr:hypothetical protein MSAN_02093700 [Mycena sanguinolenta]
MISWAAYSLDVVQSAKIFGHLHWKLVVILVEHHFGSLWVYNSTNVNMPGAILIFDEMSATIAKEWLSWFLCMSIFLVPRRKVQRASPTVLPPYFQQMHTFTVAACGAHCDTGTRPITLPSVRGGVSTPARAGRWL